ncbi:MAG: hypothetical protein JNL21_27020 [Myxococcales bacterium]|nr:hypothetical protein [Myxococcales bacterium]
MAAKTKIKTKKAPSAKSPAKSAGEARWLRERTEKRTERRFAPSAKSFAVLSWVLLGLGAAAMGAGVFGQFLRAVGPHPYALHFLGGGTLGFVLGLVLSNRVVPTLRIGDAGLAVERGQDALDRLGWHEIDAVRFSSGVLVFSGAGKVVSINVAEHPDAAAFAVAEGRARIPSRMADAPESLPVPAPEASELLVLEPPQLAGLRCAASNRLISFEADARICGRCGQAYHKEEVPERCSTCDARLT